MTPELSIFENLMIRAIKAGKDNFRLKQIIGREVYMSAKNINDFDIAIKLYKICEKYRLEKVGIEFLMELHEENDWRYTTTTIPYFERIIQRCCSILRLTRVSDLPGYRTPIRHTRFMAKEKSKENQHENGI
jgi:hypothetical protein